MKYWTIIVIFFKKRPIFIYFICFYCYYLHLIIGLTKDHLGLDLILCDYCLILIDTIVGHTLPNLIIQIVNFFLIFLLNFDCPIHNFPIILLLNFVQPLDPIINLLVLSYLVSNYYPLLLGSTSFILFYFYIYIFYIIICDCVVVLIISYLILIIWSVYYNL